MKNPELTFAAGKNTGEDGCLSKEKSSRAEIQKSAT